jgi:hypothetical protein
LQNSPAWRLATRRAPVRARYAGEGVDGPLATAADRRCASVRSMPSSRAAALMPSPREPPAHLLAYFSPAQFAPVICFPQSASPIRRCARRWGAGSKRPPSLSSSNWEPFGKADVFRLLYDAPRYMCRSVKSEIEPSRS